MPCTYYTDAEERALAAEAREEADARSKRDRRELNKVTKIACQLMAIIENAVMFDTRGEYAESLTEKLSPEARRWWRDHQARDKRRQGGRRAVQK